MSKQTEQIKSLIADIKKLRRDNVNLNQEIESLNKDLRKWSSLAAIIAGISVAVSPVFVSHLHFQFTEEQPQSCSPKCSSTNKSSNKATTYT